MKISKNEREILKRLSKKDVDIAKELCFALPTIKTYMHNLLKKFGCSNRTQLQAAILKEGVLNISDLE